jgi:uncharacterized protein with PIN domain
MRFLCDEMLKGLGRWLRAAGHDTAIVDDGIADRALIEITRAEDRLLLTCDRELATRPELEDRVLAVPPTGLDAAALELSERLGLEWLHAPFTRCLRDNAVLTRTDPSDLERIPAQARAGPGPFMVCPACARVYWPGSHVQRMRRRLERWQAG